MSTRNPALEAAFSVDQAISRLLGQTLFYGLFLGLLSCSTFLFVKRRSKAMLFITFGAFAGATANWGATTSIVINQFRFTYERHLDEDLSHRTSYSRPHSYPASLVQQWTAFGLTILSDAVVIWRAHALYTDSRRRWLVLLAPLLCLLAYVVTSLVQLIIISMTYANWSKWQRNSGARYLNRLQCAGFMLSLATNILATALILYKLWSHRQFVRDMVGKSKLFRVEGALLILVESGLAYSGFQSVSLALTVSSGTIAWRNKLLALMFLQCGPYLAAMYPVAVTIMVQLHMSQEDVMSLKTQSNAIGPQAMEFVTPSHTRVYDGDSDSGVDVESLRPAGPWNKPQPDAPHRGQDRSS